MNKGVDKLSFWQKRLEEAKAINKKHISVYISNDKIWSEIWEAHKEIFKKEIEPTDRVLDAGCGYGRASVLFDNYLGVDFSPDFIEEAKHDYPHKRFEVMDLKDLKLEDKSFDVAFCISIKNMIIGNLGIEEWRKMEKELKRVAKKILLLEYTDPSKYEILW